MNRKADWDDEPMTQEIASAIDGKFFDKALGGIMARAVNRASHAFALDKVHFEQGEGFDQLSTSEVLRQAAIAARYEAGRRKHSANGPVLDAAASVLEAVTLLRLKLEDGVPEGAAAETLAELILLGGLLAQSDFVLSGHFDGVWKDAEERRRQRAGRQKNQLVQAAVTAAWRDPFIEKCVEICRENPRMKDEDLVTEAKRRGVQMPSLETALRYLRTKRKESGPVPKRLKM